MNLEKRTKWSVLRLVKAQSGTVNWQPLITFFPRGVIEDHPDLDGMDVVKEFVESGLVRECSKDKGASTYEITEIGLAKLNELETPA